MKRLKLEKVLMEHGISKLRIALSAGVPPSDLYQALNGKKPLYPMWRKRIANTLQMNEDDLFPEYKKEV